MGEVKFPQKLALIGPMGSGKSKLARRFTEKYGGTSLDIDREFTKRYGSIPEFFARRGEAEFRRIEQKLMAEAATSDARVIATGGGAVLGSAGMNALRRECEIVYLTAPAEVLRARIEKSDRPLKNDLEKTIEARTPLYKKYADYTVDSSVDSLVELEKQLASPRRNRYDIVLADADDTLLDFAAASAQSVRRAMCSLGLDGYAGRAVDAYPDVVKTVWSRLEKGELTREELEAERVRLLSERLGVAIDSRGFNGAYIDEMRKTRFLRYGAVEFTDALRARGVKVYVITNSFLRIAEERLLPLKEHVDGFFVSEALGVYKPDARFFDKALEAIGSVDRSRVIVLGDSESSDISGGKNAGLDTCLYCPDGARATAADIKVRDYSEFLRFI